MSRIFSLSVLLLFAITSMVNAQSDTKLRALLVDGQNNHNWKATSPLLKQALEVSGRFTVDVATTPQDKKDWDTFQPDFSKYDVIISNYNGDLWPKATCQAFETYMKNGGGLVIVHAADNSFPEWPEFNKMIALGGWGGRNEKSGPYIRWRDGQIVRDMTPGSGGSHGAYHEYAIQTREPNHPIMAGLPEKWLHTADELYDRLRGPAENMTLLATAYSDKAKGGTGEHEPALFTISYGKGRVFHTILGHDENSTKCVGFITTFQRGSEWAATGKVTLPIPTDFPKADAVSRWEPPTTK
ncbi:MAG: ThuA domain-containing protein [Bacillota bacterium]